MDYMTNWIPFSFNGDWDDISGYDEASYRKIGAKIYIRGYVTCTSRDDSEIATIASGYRPSNTHRFLTKFTGGVIGWVDVNTDGTIVVESKMNWDSVLLNTEYDLE